MHIGIPKEIKNHEYRVALTPEGARLLTEAGHRVSVEAGAGAATGFPDDAYRAAGANVVTTPAETYAADLVVKVKEPQRMKSSGCAKASCCSATCIWRLRRISPMN